MATPRGRSKETAHDHSELGLFSGFEGYQTPSNEDYKRLLTSCLVVLDANVLLNLYRYDDAARDALIRVLEALGERLWVPHQVLVEFWRNRETVLRDPRDTHKAIDELVGHRDKALQAFRTWANRVSLENETLVLLSSKLTDAFGAVESGINDRDLEDASLYARDTSADPVLKVLEPVLQGKCGPALAQEAHEQAITEGLRRVEHRLPPGYMDKKKGEREAAGDYLVWEQVLIEASRRKCDVLFVTGDVKEDWWRGDGGERRGPRLELVGELRKRADCRLFMLRPTSLLEHARAHLGVDVQPESVQDVERVEQFLSNDGAAASGWTAASAAALMSRLDAQAPVQGAAIRLAARQGGRVDREQVYELGQYHDDRSLRGFTRPVTRLVAEMWASGDLSDDVGDVLVTKYDGSSVTASGFELASSFMQQFDKEDDDRQVLRFIARALDIDKAAEITIAEVAVGSGIPMPLLGVILASLHEGGYVKGVASAEGYLASVSELTEAGRAFLGWVSDLPVMHKDGSIVPMSVELDREMSELLRHGFEIESATISDDDRFSISVVGRVTEENLGFIQSLAADPDAEQLGPTDGEDDIGVPRLI